MPNCPASDEAKADERDAFHFVFAPLSDARNFLPAKLKQPTRAFRPNQQCGACGLSMFASEDHARDMAAYLFKAHKKLPKDMGTHVAYAILGARLGESTPPDDHGHYNFFEYATGNASAGFRIIGAI